MKPRYELVDRIREIAERKTRFSYDLRGRAFVDTGIVAAYRATQESERFSDLPDVVRHALDHEGIIGGWRDPETGRFYFDSCRVFTDAGSAIRFAIAQKQRSIFNLNRNEEIPVNAA